MNEKYNKIVISGIKLLWECAEMFWECIKNVLRMYWECIENVLRMFRECI